MKPSQRIVEIYNELVREEKDINYNLNALNRAIMTYLDEEYEKETECRCLNPKEGHISKQCPVHKS